MKGDFAYVKEIFYDFLTFKKLQLNNQHRRGELSTFWFGGYRKWHFWYPTSRGQIYHRIWGVEFIKDFRNTLFTVLGNVRLSIQKSYVFLSLTWIVKPNGVVKRISMFLLSWLLVVRDKKKTRNQNQEKNENCTWTECPK